MSIELPKSLQALVHALEALPGLGPRSAQRIAFDLMQNQVKLGQLVHALVQAKAKLCYCQKCHTLSETPICHVCEDPSRDHRLLCVVESAADQRVIDASLSWPGVYFVLMGRLKPLDGQGPEEVGIDLLLKRIEQSMQTPEGLTEVVIATSYTPEGDTTALSIRSAIRKYWPQLKVTRLPKGLPMGVEIEYTDLSTIAGAIAMRDQSKNGSL